MIALDTNVLVRYLVADDARQSKAAAALIDAATHRSEALYVSDIVLCELVWVLVGAYGFRKTELEGVLTGLSRARHVRFDDGDVIARALRAYFAGRGDFADYLIRAHARRAGAQRVATFDRVLLKEDGFAAP